MINEKNQKLFELASWVLISGYRNRVMIALGGKLKTPTLLSKESGVKTNHISKTLKELKDKNLIVCLNESARKGRLYQMTELGTEVMKKTKILDEAECNDF